MSIEIEEEIASIIRAYAEGSRPPSGAKYAAREVMDVLRHRRMLASEEDREPNEQLSRLKQWIIDCGLGRELSKGGGDIAAVAIRLLDAAASARLLGWLTPDGRDFTVQNPPQSSQLDKLRDFLTESGDVEKPGELVVDAAIKRIKTLSEEFYKACPSCQGMDLICKWLHECNREHGIEHDIDLEDPSRIAEYVIAAMKVSLELAEATDSFLERFHKPMMDRKHAAATP